MRDFQLQKEELIGKTHRLINSGFHPPKFFKDLWQTIAQGKVWKGEIKNKNKNGIHYWVDTTIIPFLDNNQRPYRYVSIRYDITERKKAIAEINYMVYHDELTGLPNKRSFMDYVNSLLLKKK
ncbi:MAG: PAS domain-containing protein [Bacillaceae bacterium]|nr:PAS domain-containing protein [Bacillaceae bacterium]